MFKVHDLKLREARISGHLLGELLVPTKGAKPKPTFLRQPCAPTEVQYGKPRHLLRTLIDNNGRTRASCTPYQLVILLTETKLFCRHQLLPDARQTCTEKPYSNGARSCTCGSLRLSAGVAFPRMSKTSHPPSGFTACGFGADVSYGALPDKAYAAAHPS